MSTCKSCGAQIIWARTAKGKAIPVDAEPVEGGNLTIDGNGDVHVGKPGSGTNVSHFATCAQSDEWRKG